MPAEPIDAEQPDSSLQSSVDSARSEDELSRLRERVAFYQSFDGLIQDNIARSGDLLRETLDMRESAQRSIAEAKADAERRSRADRANYRGLLDSLLGELRVLRNQTDSLEQKLTSAIAGLTDESLPESLDLIDETAPDEIAPRAETVETATEPAQDVVAEIETVPEVEISEPVAEIEIPIAPFAEPEPITESTTIVLVHGVPNAMTALSFKRFLEDLSIVNRVEPREFAEGILRIEVAGSRPLSLEDLTSWPDGITLEPIHLRPDLIEVRLAP